VSTPLVVAASAVAVVLAALGGLSTALRRRIGTAHLAGTGLLEALLVVQAVLAAADLAGGHRPAELATFLAYLVSVVLLPVAGLLWARSEPTRWAGTVLGVAGLAVAVMLWRLLDLWEVTGG
jgi:dolichyl-phosphate-mannose--protein O-mannosyl transferase